MTQREEQVKALVVKGYENKRIADALGITQKTVKFHLTNIFVKARVQSRLELAAKEYGKAITINEMDLFKELMR